jgi:D-glycero-alpha-D-manno-heptose-7-phosphate kinase
MPFDRRKPTAIRSRAPLRLGLAGGGTDLSPFCDDHGGAVLNCTIDRYAYAFLASRTDGKLVFRADDIEADEEHAFGAPVPTDGGMLLHRGVYNRFLAMGGLERLGGLTVTTTVDAPAGSGLGSSSALVVALCEGFREISAAPLGLYDIARTAFEVEREDLMLAGGKQDQYAAAFGGVNFIEFLDRGRVIVNPLRLSRDVLSELETSLIACFSGVSRESARIIDQQTSNIRTANDDALAGLFALKGMAQDMKGKLVAGDIPGVAAILAESWAAKKRTAAAISTGQIDMLMDAGLGAGAYAGKVSGAGGGGFVMFLSPPDRRLKVIKALRAAGGEASPVHLTHAGVETWHVPAAAAA